MKKEKKILSFIFLAVFVSALFFIAAPAALAEETKTESKIASPFDILQVKIPGLDALLKTDEAQVKCYGEGKDKICEYPWVGIYIKAIYKFLVGISGMLAVIVMMAGGYYWLFSGGNAGRVTQAKEYIGGAVLGLTLALGSYMILNLINPDLLSLKALRIGSIPEIEIEIEGDSATPISGSLFENAKQVGILTSGGLEAVINSAVGKVTYGLTDKQSDKARGCVERGNFIIEGNVTTICLDCSAFAGYVIKAVYKKNVPSTTTAIFNGAKEIFTERVPSSVIKKVDREKAKLQGHYPELQAKAVLAEKQIADLNKLPAGALIGWGPVNGERYGHVLISMGNGQFAQSRSGTSGTSEDGRKLGNGIKIINTETLYASFGNKPLKIYYP